MNADTHRCPSPLPLSPHRAGEANDGEREISLGAVTRGGARSSLTPGYCQAAPPGLGLARLSVGTVERIERLVGGDPVTEEQILRFIGARYGARSLFYLPPHVAAEICKRPADFIRAAKRYCEPELF